MKNLFRAFGSQSNASEVESASIDLNEQDLEQVAGAHGHHDGCYEYEDDCYEYEDDDCDYEHHHRHHHRRHHN
ncbi:MAG: hypothetical protein NVS2B12_08130 [Ktedonobacteraceae bacterium]